MANPSLLLKQGAGEAAELCREEWFRAELLALSSKGEPVCGDESKLQARPAFEEERTRYQEASKEAPSTDEVMFVYLIELDGA